MFDIYEVNIAFYIIHIKGVNGLRSSRRLGFLLYSINFKNLIQHVYVIK